MDDIFEKIGDVNIVDYFDISNKNSRDLWENFVNFKNQENADKFMNSITSDDFMKIIYKLLEGCNANKIKNIEDMIFLFYSIGNISEYTYRILIDLCDYKWHYLTQSKPYRKEGKERKYVNAIVNKFNDIFPRYRFIQTEYKITGIGRVDIFAQDKESGSHVIIECKTENHNPTKQLLAYATEFCSPILIGITERKLSKNSTKDGIMYYTYAELGIK